MIRTKDFMTSEDIRAQMYSPERSRVHPGLGYGRISKSPLTFGVQELIDQGYPKEVAEKHPNLESQFETMPNDVSIEAGVQLAKVAIHTVGATYADRGSSTPVYPHSYGPDGVVLLPGEAQQVLDGRVLTGYDRVGRY